MVTPAGAGLKPARYPLRKKRRNYWCVTTPDFLFSITLSKWITWVGVRLFPGFQHQRIVEQTTMSPFGMGCILPETVEGKVDSTTARWILNF